MLSLLRFVEPPDPQAVERDSRKASRFGRPVTFNPEKSGCARSPLSGRSRERVPKSVPHVSWSVDMPDAVLSNAKRSIHRDRFDPKIRWSDVGFTRHLSKDLWGVRPTVPHSRRSRHQRHVLQLHNTKAIQLASGASCVDLRGAEPQAVMGDKPQGYPLSRFGLLRAVT